MNKHEVKLPEMGEGIIEATITQYLVSVGDEVSIDTPIVEVATDKVDNEIVAPYDGVILELLYNEGDTVAVGESLLILGTEAETNAGTSETEQKKESTTIGTSSDTKYSQFISPTVSALLGKYKLPLSTLDNIEPTGADRRITKDDVLQYIAKKGLGITVAKEEKSTPKAESVEKTQKQPNVESSKITLAEGDTREEMGRMRKLIASHMVASVQTSPHVTSFIEADLTNIVHWRNKVKVAFEKKYGERLTFTTLFVDAVAKAIEKYPDINVSVDGDSIVKRKAIHIGMATALPDGNLIVPVIKNAKGLSLAGIASQVNSLANKARNNKLTPTDIKGSTFTLTNLGAFESLTGTPIINQPEVAILAVGSIQKKPVAVRLADGTYGVAVHDMMMLAMSYDHRVVDGGLGGNFLKEVRNLLQDFDTESKI